MPAMSVRTPAGAVRDWASPVSSVERAPRAEWAVSPATSKLRSQKEYNREKLDARSTDDDVKLARRQAGEPR
eukprot:7360147-Prymnesium_polylepis.1